MDIEHTVPKVLIFFFSPVFPPFVASAYVLFLARNQAFGDDPKKG